LVRAGVVVNPYWNNYLRDGLLVVVYMVIAAAILYVRYRLKLKSR
jgi:hypothetical protein